MDSNLARCLQLLFGVTLPHRNLEWAATAVRLCLSYVGCKTDCISPIFCTLIIWCCLMPALLDGLYWQGPKQGAER